MNRCSDLLSRRSTVNGTFGLTRFLYEQRRILKPKKSFIESGKIIGSIANGVEDEAVMQSYHRYNKNVSYEDEDEVELVHAESRQNRRSMLREFITLVDSKMKK